MNKIYLLFLLVIYLTFPSGYSVYKKYLNRIADTRELTDYKISKRNKAASMAFTEGIFRFYPSGKMDYKDNRRKLYTGTWKLKGFREANSVNSHGSSKNILFLSVANYDSHELMTEVFDYVVFAGRDHFRAYITD